MSQLQRAGGFAALSEALIYISAFIYFGGFWQYPADAGPVEKFAYLAEHQLAFSVAYFLMYVLFGILLAVLVLALHERLKLTSPALSSIAAVFGVVWVGLVIASGMISNIALAVVLDLATNDPQQAMTIWQTVYIIVDGIGGGNEIVGGLWVLLLSLAALRGKAISRPLSYLGLFVGSAGVLTIFPVDLFKDIFGLSQILWFAWMGVTLVKSNAGGTP
ncbi:DUF4386 family protein [Shewanella corallii]|uniref:DUF4386 family protein n=1 Tax=Shewanella corallii TaxID=560080 RepID=A0ABT0N6H0_9GAMM|nr:DUF4386 family protein [Shewanella corallii]MCL2914052.1 DUF4386 family protein [Shewanella corallii]